MKYVAVTWRDSGLHLSPGWEPIAEYVARAKENSGAVITVGVLIHQDADCVIVGLSIDADSDTVFGAQVIHADSVLNVRELS